MNYVWRYENIGISSVTTNRWEGQTMWTSGIAIVYSTIVQWEACALQGGWYIVITKPQGKMGEYQGATFNLPLEIAAAINRLC